MKTIMIVWKSSECCYFKIFKKILSFWGTLRRILSWRISLASRSQVGLGNDSNL